MFYHGLIVEKDTANKHRVGYVRKTSLSTTSMFWPKFEWIQELWPVNAIYQ